MNFVIHEVPWLGLGGIYEEDDLEAVDKIIRSNIDSSSGFFRLPEEPQFEEAFAEHEGANYAIMVNSCGTALDLAMMVLGIGPGDEVITTPLTFVATASCILARGAKVVFADVDPLTYNLSPDEVEKRITQRTKAVIPVHYAGLSVNIDGFKKLSEKYGVKIVYDAAHAAGSTYKGRKIGGAGDLSCYSFQSIKNMTTLGEGGAITTDREDYAKKLQSLKTFGFIYKPKDEVVEVGFNYRMTKIQSAVGMTQLKKLDRVIALRRERARYLTQKLEEVEEITTPKEIEGSDHAFHLYTLLFNDNKVGKSRDEFIDVLKKKYKIGITIHYHPIYNWKIFKKRGYNKKNTPIADRICRQLFNVPLFPKMKFEDFDYIAWAIKQSLFEIKKG